MGYDNVDILALIKGTQLNQDYREYLTAHITNLEIKKALQGIGDNRTPCIDGFSAKFFKYAWTIIGDVKKTVRYFFDHDKIYKGLNFTLMTLIPKFEEAKAAKDFRPISAAPQFTR